MLLRAGVSVSCIRDCVGVGSRGEVLFECRQAPEAQRARIRAAQLLLLRANTSVILNIYIDIDMCVYIKQVLACPQHAQLLQYEYISIYLYILHIIKIFAVWRHAQQALSERASESRSLSLSLYIYICTSISICVYVCYTYILIDMHVHMYVCMYAYIYIYIYIYVYV
jgi:hypothetical protein